MEGSIEGGAFLSSKKFTSSKLSPSQHPSKKVMTVLPCYLDKELQESKNIFRSAQVYGVLSLR